ncbi:hypothetical protein PpBr36_04658 [Pyricularia pennisetigena]|uniref:hypothetical protein n=1 Tax=Pyricularia pennisetigena TaxID=1578925 RepID=UPI00114EC30F|nr:hypothetical protein PpBr36_04658 [Pyricularia pennisetigena]TLS26901.1 hypothetical protein PpBr36_04658 [Pyricularia pennisetigena]
MSSGRRHSASGDHYSHRGRYYYDYDGDSAYASREEDDDHNPYDRRRRESSRREPMSSGRRHSPDRREHRRSQRGRSQHVDDYNPRDRYYLSDEEDLGFRSQSAQPQRTPWDESPRRRSSGDDEGDYFSRRRQSTTAGGRNHSSHRHDRSASNMSHRRRSPDYHRDYDRHESDRSGSRRDAPPMLRRQSSSAPPPASRSTYPSSSGGRRERSKYPPNTAETRNYPRGRHRSSSDRGGDDRGRRSRSNNESTAGGRSKSRSKKESPFSDVPWSQAARCALEAGTMAALRSYDSPGNWIGTKGAQIATAAVGAALVDGVIANKNPNIRGGKRHAVLRQVTNTALGNLIMNPAGSMVEKKEPVNRTKHAIHNRMHRSGGGRRH